MCPYENKHSGKSKKLRKGILENLDNWEKKELDLTENTNQ
tara:strand:- start:108 stop:227 length:120 start_codon:yes stop_codon:yes gene_type:complete